MLFLCKNKHEQFYVNPEDAKKYADKGYEIIDERTGNVLTSDEVNLLKPTVIETPVFVKSE